MNEINYVQFQIHIRIQGTENKNSDNGLNHEPELADLLRNELFPKKCGPTLMDSTGESLLVTVVTHCWAHINGLKQAISELKTDFYLNLGKLKIIIVFIKLLKI